MRALLLAGLAASSCFGPAPSTASSRAALGSISFVQSASQSGENVSGTQVWAVFPSTQEPGDMNVVVVGGAAAGGVVSSLSDTSGNTYAVAVSLGGGQGYEAGIYYAANIGGASAGQNQVTVGITPPNTPVEVEIFEYAGLDLSVPLDATGGGGNSGALVSVNATPSASTEELVVLVGAAGSSLGSPGTGFTARYSDANLFVEDGVVMTTATAPVTATATLVNQDTWIAELATFRAADTSGGPDAGSESDGGATSDAGFGDAGSGDAGAALDAGSAGDGGLTPDGGPEADAGADAGGRGSESSALGRDYAVGCDASSLPATSLAVVSALAVALLPRRRRT